MKKFNIILISTVVVFLVAVLAYYGLGPSKGTAKEPEMVILEVPLIDTIDLSRGISSDVWESLPAKDIEMIQQVMVLPWGKSLISPLTVKSFHDGKNIYFYVSWKDDTENRNTGLDEFPDGVAIMSPLGDDVQPSMIMMGKSSIWQWKADIDKEYWLSETQKTGAYSDFYYPFEENETFVVSKSHPRMAVHDLNSIRVGTLTHKPYHNVEGRGLWDKGTWRVVFKSSLKPYDPELDAQFNPGEKRFIAFAVWNGANGDRGSRKSISNGFVTLDIKEGAK